MIEAHTTDIAKGWPYDAESSVTMVEAQELCVKHEEWQRIRLSMKGVPTHGKLVILQNWLQGMKKSTLSTGFVRVEELDNSVRVKQIANYLGALRRGGQLDSNNMIRKYI